MSFSEFREINEDNCEGEKMGIRCSGREKCMTPWLVEVESKLITSPAFASVSARVLCTSAQCSEQLGEQCEPTVTTQGRLYLCGVL